MAFSHNPLGGSFAPLGFQPSRWTKTCGSAVPLVMSRTTVAIPLSYYRAKRTCLKTV